MFVFPLPLISDLDLFLRARVLNLAFHKSVGFILCILLASPKKPRESIWKALLKKKMLGM